MFIEPEVKDAKPLEQTCGNCLYHCRYTQHCYLPEKNYPGSATLMNMRLSFLDACQDFVGRSN